MKRLLHLILMSVVAISFAGCGYSVRSSALNFRTIYIEPFKNKVNFDAEGSRSLYLPLLEVKLTNALTDRYMFDGNLRVTKKDKADVLLQGELLGIRRDALRYTDDNDVQEYRITITVSMTLWDNVEQKPMWSESSFSGDTTYFTTGSQAKSESVAIDDALTDIARRIVERTVENW